MKRFFSRIISYFRGPQWHVKPNHEIKLAFSHKGKNYYHFVNALDMSYMRYMAAQDAIIAMEYRLDKPFIEWYNKLFQEYFNKQDWKNLAILQNNFYQRSQYLSNEELLLSLASVWYFDESENPYTYNHEYNEEKIRSWRGDSELLGELLKTPLKNYVPVFDTYNMTTEKYLKAAKVEELMTLKSHLSTLLKLNGKEEVISSIKSRIAELSK